MISDRIKCTTITDHCILLYLHPSFALWTSKCFHISLFLFFLSFLMDCNVQIAATNGIKRDLEYTTQLHKGRLVVNMYI